MKYIGLGMFMTGEKIIPILSLSRYLGPHECALVFYGTV